MKPPVDLAPGLPGWDPSCQHAGCPPRCPVRRLMSRGSPGLPLTLPSGPLRLLLVTGLLALLLGEAGPASLPQVRVLLCEPRPTGLESEERAPGAAGGPVGTSEGLRLSRSGPCHSRLLVQMGEGSLMTLVCPVSPSRSSTSCRSGVTCACNWCRAVSPQLSSCPPCLGSRPLRLAHLGGQGRGRPTPSWQQTATLPRGSCSTRRPVLPWLHRGLDSEELALLPQAISQGRVSRHSPRGGPVSPGTTGPQSCPQKVGWSQQVWPGGALEPSLCRCSPTTDPTPVTSLFQVLIKAEGHVGGPEWDTKE